MADGLIDMIIPSADYDALTATNKKVSKDKKYVGENGVSGIGEVPVEGSPEISLPVNGTILLPEGIYEGGSVGQKITTFPGMHVLPGSKEISVPTKDRYMVGVVFVDPLENLVPENIKEGEYVGGVGPGTWKGFVVTDPKTFYYRGAFAPGQALEDYPDTPYEDTYKLTRTDTDRHIHLYARVGRGTSSLLVFSSPIDITSIKKLKLQLMCSGITASTDSSNLGIHLYREKHTSFSGEETPVFSKGFEFKSGDNNIIKNLEIDLSAYSRNIYLHLFPRVKLKSYMYIRIVQFE